MAAVKQELVDLSAEVWQRLRSRLDGLSDEEYLWEPAPGCWTVRRRDDGGWRADRAVPGPEPEPFTTLAWRLVERGADLTARDPEFDARPLEWARFSGQPHVAAWLEAHTDG